MKRNSRQPQPSWRPPLHQEQGPLLPPPQRQHLPQRGFPDGARRPRGRLDPALEHVGGGADGGGHGAGDEGREHVRPHVVLHSGVGEQNALRGGVSNGPPAWRNGISSFFFPSYLLSLCGSADGGGKAHPCFLFVSPPSYPVGIFREAHKEKVTGEEEKTGQGG